MLTRWARRAGAAAGVTSSSMTANWSCAASISVGLAALDGTMESPEDLVARADAALYEAKRAGRNCVRASQDSS